MTRDGLMLDAYNSLAKAKKLLAIAQAAEPADDIGTMNEANRARVTRARLHIHDSLRSITALLEM